MKLSTLSDTPDALFDGHIAVNLRGSFNTMREAARGMREDGRIINLSSSVVGLYQPTYGVYAATKAAIEAMTHVLAKELRGVGTRRAPPEIRTTYRPNASADKVAPTYPTTLSGPNTATSPRAI
jgi:NAD(P)-dependent dehydrogenase (short-subunit alcohol dehydrogenase family)